MPFIIDDDTPLDLYMQPVINGERKGHGHDPDQVERGVFRPLFGDAPDQLKIIPRNEWDARIEEQDRMQSSLWHIRQYAANGQQMPTLDQNGQGYCWAYSTTRCVMYLRALMNQPYIRLSAHAIGCMVKGFRDEGGWCGLSAKFLREKGVPSVNFWKEKSMSRDNDKDLTWQNAALHTVTEDWVDAASAVYDQNLTFDQMATCLLLNIPCALDFNHWAHSVCGIRLRRVEAGSYGPEIDNSWTDEWGENGTAVMRGSKGIPDGAVALRVTGASTV
jgi:hypothetical protein